jgi:hypothetical protein
LPYVRTHHIIRPVYIVRQEIDRPDLCPIDITRNDRWTLVGVHPTADPTAALQAIAARIRAGEVPPWMAHN